MPHMNYTCQECGFTVGRLLAHVCTTCVSWEGNRVKESRQCDKDRYDGVSDPSLFSCDEWGYECYECHDWSEECGEMLPTVPEDEIEHYLDDKGFYPKCKECPFKDQREIIDCDPRITGYEFSRVDCKPLLKHKYEVRHWLPEMECIDPKTRQEKLLNSEH